MTQQIAFSLFNKNIRVNCVAPGVIKTPFSQGVSSGSLHKYFNLLDIDREKDLCARYGTVQEVASIVAFLLSDDSSYISGNTILASGGYTYGRCL
ncbi:Dehydrogenase/reductase SDR family member 4 [Holothuria leucospilota]|uniref:Dehydrogenase/reductase SDR family member 4 n=1 Tax=Holothuria leucospilota TaxID=206669 RepID=A0A9Q1CST9_HOLLE|nr:Dehydrogenase/reductase SDR family member 4 [Holothuria leucospilota]